MMCSCIAQRANTELFSRGSYFEFNQEAGSIDRADQVCL